jgi:hypothetical protein
MATPATGAIIMEKIGLCSRKITAIKAAIRAKTTIWAISNSLHLPVA